MLWERESERERERERNIDVRNIYWLPSCTHPDWGLNLQPGYVLWLGIEPTTFGSVGQCSNQLMARAAVPFFFKRFYLFVFREQRREREREKNINVWSPLAHPPTGDLASNLGMCPRLGIEPATLWFAGPGSIHWTPPARAPFFIVQSKLRKINWKKCFKN